MCVCCCCCFFFVFFFVIVVGGGVFLFFGFFFFWGGGGGCFVFAFWSWMVYEDQHCNELKVFQNRWDTYSFNLYIYLPSRFWTGAFRSRNHNVNSFGSKQCDSCTLTKTNSFNVNVVNDNGTIKLLLQVKIIVPIMLITKQMCHVCRRKKQIYKGIAKNHVILDFNPPPNRPNPAGAGIFSGSSHTSDLKIGTPVATLPGAWRYRVSAGTGRPGVSIL